MRVIILSLEDAGNQVAFALSRLQPVDGTLLISASLVLAQQIAPLLPFQVLAVHAKTLAVLPLDGRGTGRVLLRTDVVRRGIAGRAELGKTRRVVQPLVYVLKRNWS
jgi:hypothetical protein